ncbi:MAG: Maf family protein, partial [Rhizobiaceae bacterium]
MKNEKKVDSEYSAKELILASTSPFRAQLMRDAGLDFIVVRPDLDERAVEQSLGDSEISAADLAEVLAIAKACNVSESNPHAMVIGCDQTLNLGDEILHKPEDLDEARRRLLQLSGRTHDLNSAVSLVSQGETVWSQVVTCHITFRKLDPG